MNLNCDEGRGGRGRGESYYPRYTIHTLQYHRLSHSHSYILPTAPMSRTNRRMCAMMSVKQLITSTQWQQQKLSIDAKPLTHTNSGLRIRCSLPYELKPSRQKIHPSDCNIKMESEIIGVKRLENKPGEAIVTRHYKARFYCVECHKTYQKCKCKVYVSADTLKGGRCGQIRLTGEQSPFWTGGSPAKRVGGYWRRLRREIIAEQKGICSNCHKYVGQSLHIHHIKPYREFESGVEANNITNLIGLCNYCHPRAEKRNQKSKSIPLRRGKGQCRIRSKGE
jgi:hypothetical protein